MANGERYWQTLGQRRVNRRRFLAGSGVAAAGSVGILAGCGSEPPAASPAETHRHAPADDGFVDDGPSIDAWEARILPDREVAKSAFIAGERDVTGVRLAGRHLHEALTALCAFPSRMAPAAQA